MNKFAPPPEAELQEFMAKLADDMLGELGEGSADCYGFHIVVGIHYKDREMTCAVDEWRETQNDLLDELNRKYAPIGLEFEPSSCGKRGCSVHLWLDQGKYEKYVPVARP